MAAPRVWPKEELRDRLASEVATRHHHLARAREGDAGAMGKRQAGLHFVAWGLSVLPMQTDIQYMLRLAGPGWAPSNQETAQMVVVGSLGGTLPAVIG